MIRTARKIVPAVAVIAVLGTGWASAAALTGGSTRSEGSRTPVSANKPVPLPAAETTGAQAPTLPPSTSPPTSGPPAIVSPTIVSPTTVSPTTLPATKAAATTGATQESPRQARPSGELANCGVGEGTYRPATEAEFRTVITGVWLLCGGPSFFGTYEAGMELTADGRWSKLERRPNGSLARVGGWENEGAWETIDTSLMNGRPSFQLNFLTDGGGGGMTHAEFGQGSSVSEVTKVRLSNMGVVVADYVPAPGSKISPVPFPPAPGKGCEAREEPYAPASEAEFRTVMTRAWVLCGTPSVFGTNEDGLEIRADGRWSKLYRNYFGSLVRGTDPSDRGTWETFDTSAMNGRPTFQLNLNVDEGGGVITIPAFAAGRHGDVSKVRLANNGVFVADYLPAPAGTSIITL